MASEGFVRIILSTLKPYDVSATHEVKRLVLGVKFVQIMSNGYPSHWMNAPDGQF